MTYLDCHEVEERITARCDEYRAGDISAAVLRASLFALGKRGRELHELIREQEQFKHDRQIQAAGLRK